MKIKFNLLIVGVSLLFTTMELTAQTSTIPWNSSGSNTFTNPLANNVGINIATPLCKLHLTNGSVLFNGTTGVTPTSGAGNRMMWIPSKSAFRAGQTIAVLGLGADVWDDTYVGVGSCAFNQNTKATGVNSSAFGIFTVASNAQSFACGYTSIASGPNSFCSGYGSQATGDKSTAVSWGNLASGIASFASGSGTTASGAYSSTFGYHPIASGVSSFAAGTYSTAAAYNSFVIGQYNQSAAYSGITWVATEPLFVIGNGTSTVATSNALTVLKNGNVSIGTNTTPTYKLQVESGNTDACLLKTTSTSGFGMKIEITSNTNKAIVVENSGTVNFKVLGNGEVWAREVTVTMSTFPDYVFSKNYNLLSLKDVASYINTNNHLPNMPSAKDVADRGIGVGELQLKLVEKVEELTLYLLEQNKKLEELKQDNVVLKKQVDELKK